MNPSSPKPKNVPPPQPPPAPPPASGNRIWLYVLSVAAIAITGLVAFIVPNIGRQANQLTQARQATLLNLDIDGTFYARITLTAVQNNAQGTATAVIRAGFGLSATETAVVQGTAEAVLNRAATGTAAVFAQTATGGPLLTAQAATKAVEAQITAAAGLYQTSVAATLIATRQNGAQLGTLAAQNATLNALETVSAAQQAARLATAAAQATTNAIRERALRNSSPISPANATKVAELYDLPHAGAVTAVSVSPDGTLLATTSADVITVWEVRTGKIKATLSHGGLQINHVIFSPDGRLIVTAGNDGTVWVWAIGEDKPRYILKGHDGSVFRVAFSPDGSLLASGGADKALIWSVSTGKIVASPPSGWAWDVQFSPGGRYLYTAGGDGKVRVWGVPAVE